MGSKDLGFDVIYRGQIEYFILPGRMVFIQRLKEYGGGYLLGRAYENAFIFEIERPVSLREGIDYIMLIRGVAKHVDDFDDDFKLV